MAVAIAQFTIKDLNDITTSTTAPSNPTNGQLWLDTSTTPNVLKKYNGSSWEVTGASSIDIIGGTNLIQNSNGTFGKTNWNNYITAVDSDNIYGTAFRINNLGTTEIYASQTIEINVLPNTQYTFSALAKGDANVSTFEMYAIGRKSSDSAFAYTYIHGSGNKTLSTIYTKFSFTFMTNSDEVKLFVRFDHNGSKTSGALAQLWATDFKLEQGNKATDWSPAPEDAQSQIDALNDFVNSTYSSDKKDIYDAIGNATSQLAGTTGGYVVIDQDDNKKPYEILIMDTPDRGTAKNVWRWNSGGLGFSSNGYNGPYTTAITSDGKIVADFITTGTLLATLIKGGTLTLGGGTAYGNGSEIVRDVDGNIIGTWDSTGITINKGTITGSTIDAKDTLIIDGTSDWAQLQFTSYWNKNGYIYANDQRGLNFDGDTSAMFNLPLSASFGLTPQYTWNGTIPTNGTITITHNLYHAPPIFHLRFCSALCRASRYIHPFCTSMINFYNKKAPFTVYNLLQLFLCTAQQ